jgi:D-lactate dehydrogenase (cytochrome)
MTAFRTVEDAGEAVSAVIAQGCVPATIEMLDQVFVQMIEEYTQIGLPVEAGAVVFVDVDGYQESVSPQIKKIHKILTEYGAYETRIAQTDAERERIWFSRKSAAGAIARISPYSYNADGTIPRSKLAQCIRRINQICTDLDLPYGYISHVGDGNLHPGFFIQDPDNEDVMRRVAEGGQRLSSLFVELGGTITGEHGVGIEKRELMHLMHSPEELQAMMEIKAVFDPEGLLNPGKIFPRETHAPSSPQEHTSVLEIPESPTSTEETAQAIRQLYADNRIFGVKGGGTKIYPHLNTEKILCTDQLRGIYSFSPEELSITVGAGSTLKEVNEEISKAGMMIPLNSPWEGATLGGIISARFNAPLRLRYGSIRDLVQALRVVLPDGRIIRAGRALMKDVAGYDLTKLFIGAYGTLGVITEISLKLAPLPAATFTLAVPITSVQAGLKLGSHLLQSTLIGSTLLLNHRPNGHPDGAPFQLIFSAEGSAEDVEAESEAIHSTIQKFGYDNSHQLVYSGMDFWNQWIGEDFRNETLVRIGIPTRTANSLLSNKLISTLADSEFLVDLPHGLIYRKGFNRISQIRQEIAVWNGYALVTNPGSVPSNSIDTWACTPESISVMRSIKEQWDPKGLLNPNGFIL